MTKRGIPGLRFVLDIGPDKGVVMTAGKLTPEQMAELKERLSHYDHDAAHNPVLGPLEIIEHEDSG